MSQPDMSAFAKYIPGFEFLQNLTRQTAAGAAPELQSGVPGMPPLSHWVAPTFDVEELEKRIQDLKAVHFWLDQNTKALGATIQALEVQRMTLATLKNMNVSLAEVAEAFKIKPAAPTESPAEPEAPEEEPQSTAQAVDPMLWWSALTQQFQEIASNVVRDMADQVAQTVQASAEAAAQPAAATPAAPEKKPRRKAPAKSASGQKAPSPGRKTPVKAPARKRSS